jgi:anti-sigma factor ChrR (cupin superfamily)
VFQAVLAQIDSDGVQLPGFSTQRASAAGWLDLSPGVTCRVLREDAAIGRRSVLIRMQPGAAYHSHAHDDTEECLVIEGDLRFGDLELRAGDFHVALEGSVHPVGHTVGGCLLHITAGIH